MKQTIKNIFVNFNDLKSITNGEKQKTQLENNNYTLKKEEHIGFDKFKLTYTKQEPQQ